MTARFARVRILFFLVLVCLAAVATYAIRSDKHYRPLEHVTSSALASLPEKGEWKQLRSDGANTGYQPRPTGILNPVERSGLNYTGYAADYAVFKDVNGDGKPDLIVPESSGISAWTQDGIFLWRNRSLPRGLQILDALDIVGDGTIQIALLGDGHLYFLDGATGTLRFDISVFPQKIYFWNVHFGRFVKGATGRQMVVALNNGSGTEPGASIQTRMYSFAKGLAAPVLAWGKVVEESTKEKPVLVYWASSVVGDVDNDGMPELVTAIGKGFVIQDLVTGRVKSRIGADWNRSYGTFVIGDLDNDGENELLVASDLLEQHFHVFRCSIAQCNLLSKRDLGSAWPLGRSVVHLPGSSPLIDAHGDGRKDVIVSEWVPNQGWTLEIFDALTGKLVKSAAGYYVLWVGDLNGDGKDEVVVSKENTILPRDFSTIEILSFSGSSVVSLWKMDHVRLESRRSSFIKYGFVDDIPGIKSRSTDNRQPFFVESDPAGRRDLLFAHDKQGNGFADELLIVGAVGHGEFGVAHVYSDHTGNMGTLIAVHGAAGVGSEVQLITSSVDGAIKILTGDNHNNISQRKSFRTSQFRTESLRYLVADIDGDGANELLLEDGAGVSAIKVTQSSTFKGARSVRKRILWNIAGAHLHVVTTLKGSLPRTIVSKHSADGSVVVAAVNGDGSVDWETRMPLLSDSYILDRPVYDIKPGNFTGNGRNDLFVVGSLNIQSGNGDANRAWLLNGENGQIVWYNDASDSRFPLKSIGPGKEGGIVPVDLNGDGADDIAMISQIFYVALDGKTGAIISDPEDVMHALQKKTRVPYQWTSSAATSLIDPRNDGHLGVLVHASTGAWGPLVFEQRMFSWLGKKRSVAGLWKSTPARQPGFYEFATIGDLDGDGHPEVIVGNGDNVTVISAMSGERKYLFAGLGEVRFVATVRGPTPNKCQIVAVGGRDIFLLSIEDGRPVVSWRYFAGATLGSPIVADIGNVGLSEILAPTNDGRFVILGR